MRGHRRLWYLLLLAPYVALLWVPFYAKLTPKLFGFPFFYWYQFLWVVLSALITLAVYVATRPAEPRSDDGGVQA
jgi:membrane protein implicated in regulation of membrane protease activity